MPCVKSVTITYCDGTSEAFDIGADRDAVSITWPAEIVDVASFADSHRNHMAALSTSATRTRVASHDPECFWLDAKLARRRGSNSR